MVPKQGPRLSSGLSSSTSRVYFPHPGLWQSVRCLRTAHMWKSNSSKARLWQPRCTFSSHFGLLLFKKRWPLAVNFSLTITPSLSGRHTEASCAEASSRQMKRAEMRTETACSIKTWSPGRAFTCAIWEEFSALWKQNAANVTYSQASWTVSCSAINQHVLIYRFL